MTSNDEKFEDLIESNNHEQPTKHKSSDRTEKEYEDLVRQAPNDSQLWIEYIQFFIDQAEIDRARALAERALGTIYYR